MITLQYRIFIKSLYFTLLVVATLSCRQSGPVEHVPPDVIKLYKDSIMQLDSIAVSCMNLDTVKAYIYATRAVSLAQKTGTSEYLIRALNEKGLILHNLRNDSATYYFNLALAISDTSRYKESRGAVFYHLSMIYTEVNDFKNASRMLDSSIHAAYNSREFHAAAASLNSLGNVYLASDDQAMARICYDSAIQIASLYDLPREKGIAMGSISQFLKTPDSSLTMMREAIRILENVYGTELEQANILINMGVLQTNSDSALYFYRRATMVGERCRFNIVLLGAWNNLAYVYLERGDLKSATECLLNKAIPLALEIDNADWLATLYDSYVDVLIAKREYRNALTFLRKSIETRDISDKKIAKKQIRLLNAMLDLNRKNMLILEKEQQIALHNASRNRMKLWLAAAGGAVLVMAFALFWYRQRNRNRIQLLKFESARRVIEAEEHEKEKNSMELHDAIGILTSKINLSFEHSASTDITLKYDIIKHVDDFSLEVRGISHRMSSRILKRHSFAPLIIELCNEAVRYGKLNLLYEVAEPPSVLSAIVRLHIYRIVQELMNNARKYAPEANIRLTVAFHQTLLELIYQDNGSGFSKPEATRKGMGFSNIFARVDLLNGTCEIESEPGCGVYWRITAPLESSTGNGKHDE